MPVDLKSELTRPLALILAALAALGWVLLGLSSWSTASVHKAQRMQILEASEKNEKLAAELSRQLKASGEFAELQGKLASTRDDLNRMTLAKSDLQQELTGTQRDLQARRKDLTDLDRNLQTQTQKLSELQTNTTETGSTASDAPEPRAGRSYGRRGRWSRRGRTSRSFSIISRSR